MKLSLRCSQYSQQISACLKPISCSGKDTATAYQLRHAGTHPTAGPAHSIPHPTVSSAHSTASPMAPTGLLHPQCHSVPVPRHPLPTTMVPEHPLPHGTFSSAERLKVFSGKQVPEGDGKLGNVALE